MHPLGIKKRGNDSPAPPKFRHAGSESGFTLVELILATAISALVVGILSACLSFALRAWESTQNRRPDHSASLVSLLKRQLAELDPTPVKFEDGPQTFFAGDGRSLTFATSHSVKAISRGVPVAARYVYDAKNKVVFYAEIPFDPYHPQTLRSFMQLNPPGGPKDSIRFHAVEVADFSLAYAGKDKGGYIENWDKEKEAPSSVLLQWTTREGPFGQLLYVNSPFYIEVDKIRQLEGATGRRS